MDGANALRYVLDHNIEGVIVECGVETGSKEDEWIRELQKTNAVRDIYMYDTFAGLPRPTAFDYTCSDAKHYSMSSAAVYSRWRQGILNETTNDWCYTPLEHVQARLQATGYPQDKLHYIVGDVMDTLKDKSTIPETIAILRLDTDWYESSKFELEQMYDNVVSGGVVIFDDYYHWDGQRRATDEFFASRGITPPIVNLGNHQAGAMIKN
jgi:O-methyltransferase